MEAKPGDLLLTYLVDIPAAWITVGVGKKSAQRGYFILFSVLLILFPFSSINSQPQKALTHTN